MCHRAAMHPHWGRHHARAWKKHHFKHRWMYPPVNVEELDDRYEIKLFAAGYSKEDFMLTLADDTLTVSAKKPHGSEEANFEENEVKSHWSRRRFSPSDFERDFILNDKIDAEKLSAQYQDGVLIITLPKKVGSETIRKEINIE